MLTVGEGSQRQEFESGDREFIALVLSLTQPRAETEILKALSESLDVEGDCAASILANLVKLGVLMNAEPPKLPVTSSMQLWEAWGWRDAIDFHSATRDMVWRHSYTSEADKPPIMTYRLGDQLVEPDRPKPGRKAPADSWMRLELDSPSLEFEETPFEEALRRRRTIRNFAALPLKRSVLSDLLGHALRRRTLPSGRHVRPTPTYSLGNHFSCYVAALNISDVDPGMYWYNELENALYRIQEGEFAASIVQAAQDQPFLRNASAALILSVHWDQYMWKYRFSRAYRIALFEIAGVVQTLLVAASAAGVASFLTPALDDDLAAALCGIEDSYKESPMYVVGLGYAQAGPADEQDSRDEPR